MRVCRPVGANTGSTIEVVRSTERPAGTYRKKPDRGSQRPPVAPTLARRSVGALTRIACPRDFTEGAPSRRLFSPPSVQRHLSQQSTSLSPRITPLLGSQSPLLFSSDISASGTFCSCTVPAPTQHATHCPPTPFSFLLPSPALFTGRVCVRLSLPPSYEACAPQHAARPAPCISFFALLRFTQGVLSHTLLSRPRVTSDDKHARLDKTCWMNAPLATWRRVACEKYPG
jgi:hypothetical protein